MIIYVCNYIINLFFSKDKINSKSKQIYYAVLFIITLLLLYYYSFKYQLNMNINILNNYLILFKLFKKNNKKCAFSIFKS